MKISASVYPTQPIGELLDIIVAAEELSYSAVYLGDSQSIWRETFTLLGAAAAKTNRIRLATGVSNLVTRHTSVVAAGFLSLAEYAPGRVIAGLGVGDSSLATIGRRAMTLDEFSGAIADFRTLCRGEEIGSDSQRTRINYADNHVPVYIAATGPRILQLSGRIADGVIVLAGADPAAVTTALALVADGERLADRPPRSTRRVLWLPTAIDDDGDKARSLVRPHVARTALRPQPHPLSADLLPAVEKLRANYDYFQHMSTSASHADLVPRPLIDRFALAGTPEEASQQLSHLCALPLDEIVCVPFAATEAQRVDTLRAFATAVSPHLAGTA